MVKAEGHLKLQQPLPFTVLKPVDMMIKNLVERKVATALTVYGIETHYLFFLA